MRHAAVLRQKLTAGPLNVAHIFGKRHSDVPGPGEAEDVSSRVPLQPGVCERIDRAGSNFRQRTEHQHGDTVGMTNQRIPRNSGLPQLLTAGFHLRPVDLMEAASAHEPEDRELRVEISAHEEGIRVNLAERAGNRLELRTRELEHREPLAVEAAGLEGTFDVLKMFNAEEASFPGAPGQKQIAHHDIIRRPFAGHHPARILLKKTHTTIRKHVSVVRAQELLRVPQHKRRQLDGIDPFHTGMQGRPGDGTACGDAESRHGFRLAMQQERKE